MTTTILITGATSGLGLATATELGRRGADVLCAGRDERALELARGRSGGDVVRLDHGSLADLVGSADRLPPVHAVACNAGVQLVRGGSLTRDGFEETFQVNVLAHVALLDVLLHRAAPPRRVVLVGSRTHDPDRWTGTPPPDERRVPELARDTEDRPSPLTAGMIRYTTSKLLLTALVGALSRERPDVHVLGFDPGVMPGTGLARHQPPVARALWGSVLRALRVLPFASSPTASGHALAALLDGDVDVPSGTVVDQRLRPVTPSVRARDTGYQDAVLRDCRRLLATGPQPAADGRSGRPQPRP